MFCLTLVNFQFAKKASSKNLFYNKTKVKSNWYNFVTSITEYTSA